MSPSAFLRVPVSKLALISICIVFVAVALVWTTRPQAGASGANLRTSLSSAGVFVADKGGITPEAATIVVNSLSDLANASDGLCTLREAINAANNNVASGGGAGECAAGSSSGADAINFSVTGTIELTSALPNINSDMTINGPGSALLTVHRNTAVAFRIFNIPSGVVVSLSGVTVTNGLLTTPAPNSGGAGIQNLGTLTMNDVAVSSNAAGVGVFNSSPGGGGIFNQGTLTITNCSITGNTTANTSDINFRPLNGGGLNNSGTLTMTNCVVSNNRTGDGTNTGGLGGGIYNTGQMTVTGTTISNNVTGNGGTNLGGYGGGIMNVTTAFLINSTVSGNSTGTLPNPGFGGGIDNLLTMTIIGSTISGNTSSFTASGIFNQKTLVVFNSTVSGNHGNGIENQDSSVSLNLVNSTITLNDGIGVNSPNNISRSRSSIIAGNIGSDVNGSYTSDGHNLIGNKGTASGFVNGTNADQVGTSGSPINPLIGPLADNGGPTRTHALLSTSPALDAGDNCVTDANCGDAGIPQLTTDQRGAGFGRIVDGPDGDATATVDIGAYETQTPLANLADTSTNEDIQVQVTFDGGDTSTINTVTASSSNVSLVPNDAAHLSVVMKGSTGVVTINPATNAIGTANITVTIDRTGGPESKTFLLTVNAVNDAPSFTKGPDQVVSEDAGAQTVNNWATSISAGGPDEAGQVLTFQITSNTNGGLFSAVPAISSAGTLTYTPAANASGSATITVNLKDDGGAANGGVDTSPSQTFTITVNSVNDPPSFAAGASQTVNEDAGAQTVTNWATSISRGPADETAQTLTFTASNDNNALFSTQPAISSTGTLTYTPAVNASGTATVTVTLKDSGGTANGGNDTSAPQAFTVLVTSVNDAPTFTKGANQTVNEDAGAQTVPTWATAISAGAANESGQALTFQVTGNTNAALFSAAPGISATGTLTYTPASDANGSATITINLKDDGGTANGGVDTSVSTTFTITVNSVNDAPSFTRGADQSVSNNAGAQTVPNWATSLSAGPTNESGQALTFQVTGNTNPGLFTTAPAVSSTGTLTYTPASNMGGSSTITIRLQDSGGTANGGVNTSASQSFNITVIPVGGFIDFSSATNNTTESSGFTTVTVKRTGDLTRAVTVNYASSPHNGLPCSTANGVATPKCDFTAALGTLSFAASEDTKLVNILVSQDGFVEGPETFTVTLSNPSNNAALGTISVSTTTIADDATEPAPPTNVIDDPRNFVRQHYHDFLNREPDPSGWDFWTNQITSCGSDVQCNEVRRIDVSASFFLSIEFQQTGYLVERFYKVGYGDATGNSTFPNPHTLAVPIVRANEFLTDTQRIGRGVVVLQTGWEQVLENNKQAYALEFIQTARFTAALPTTMTPAQFVTRLNQNAGGVLTLAEQQTAIDLFGGAGNTTNQTARAQAVRMVAEDQDLYNAEFNRAFVLAQYFGYLRRNPNDGPDTDYTGYDFWLTKLNQFNGSYINAEMVKAFLSSIEYRQRFGQ